MAEAKLETRSVPEVRVLIDGARLPPMVEHAVQAVEVDLSLSLIDQATVQLANDRGLGRNPSVCAQRMPCDARDSPEAIGVPGADAVPQLLAQSSRTVVSVAAHPKDDTERIV